YGCIARERWRERSNACCGSRRGLATIERMWTLPRAVLPVAATLAVIVGLRSPRSAYTARRAVSVDRCPRRCHIVRCAVVPLRLGPTGSVGPVALGPEAAARRLRARRSGARIEPTAGAACQESRCEGCARRGRAGGPTAHWRSPHPRDDRARDRSGARSI